MRTRREIAWMVREAHKAHIRWCCANLLLGLLLLAALPPVLLWLLRLR